MQVDQEMDEIDAATPVQIISPDESAQSSEPKLRADDYEAMKANFMPPLPDLETLEETDATWDITNWRDMARREHGPTFQCAGFPWRVLFFPWGNGVECASFYLEHGFGENEQPAENWYACVQFLLVLWNPNDPRMFVQHTATHRFTADEGDWGFTRFVELRRIFSVPWESFERPLVENNTAKLTAFVRVVKDPTGVLWHSFLNYDSKKETGMVGLKNQGATCYLNSLLQSLFLTPAFRKAVYQIPTNVEGPAKSNHAYALQRLFLQLQISENAVATNELTSSFGWDTRQIFEQQDVQELSRVLMERLEEKMKGTEAENALAKMFVGKMKTYIDCINVDYQSSRIEDFWDLQLNVSKMTGIDDSFRDYCQVETMEGDNKYHAEGFGLQDARKGVIFESLPSVLHLQLKRFEYDFAKEQMMKINDRFEFPETWDATPYLSEDADRSESYIYRLHGVLVHAGDVHAGHYYAFLKPGKDDDFYKFDDDRVTRATLKEAIDDNFGGEYPMQNGAPGQKTALKPPKRSSNAYMLVYIRACHYERVLLNEEVVEPPYPIVQKWEEERAFHEKRKKDRDEAHLYSEVSVATNANFRNYEGFDIVPFNKVELVSELAYPKIHRVKKKMTIEGFVDMVAKDMGVKTHLVRPWCMVGRQNSTVRPDIPLNVPEMTVEEATMRYGHKQVLRIWIEEAVSVAADGSAIFGDATVELHKTGDKPILLFLKAFDVETQKLYGVGSFYASNGDKVSELSPYIVKLLGWPAATPHRVFEVSFNCRAMS
jgi:ubiquitin carboxyl-terminal hydrolase 7